MRIGLLQQNCAYEGLTGVIDAGAVIKHVCSWFVEDCWREEESVQNLPNRQYGGQESAKQVLNYPWRGPRGDQPGISAQPNM